MLPEFCISCAARPLWTLQLWESLTVYRKQHSAVSPTLICLTFSGHRLASRLKLAVWGSDRCVRLHFPPFWLLLRANLISRVRFYRPLTVPLTYILTHISPRGRQTTVHCLHMRAFARAAVGLGQTDHSIRSGIRGGFHH